MKCLKLNADKTGLLWVGSKHGLDFFDMSLPSLLPGAGASTGEGEVDATCIQIGLRGEENYTLKGGRIHSVFVHKK